MTAGRNSGAALGADYTKPPSAEEIDWQLKGLCRTMDPQLWTPDPPEVEAKSKLAKRYCLDCPVVYECREWALKHREMYGVWGGLSEGEREAIWSNRRRKRREHKSAVSFYE